MTNAEIIRKIADRLVGIDIADMTTSERQITDILVKNGIGEINIANEFRLLDSQH